MIALSMNRTDYENDIRSLLMAFFYGEKIVLNGEEWNVCLDVRYTENHTALVLKDHNGRSLEKEGDCHFEDYRLGRNDIKNLVGIYGDGAAMGDTDRYSTNETAHGDV